VKDGKVSMVLDQKSLGANPNGIALSPDEKFLYLTAGNKLKRYAVNPDDTLGEGTLFAEGEGITDGMKVDRKGNVYSSSGAGPGIIRITSPDGKLLGFLNLPIVGGEEPKRQICATNEAFGGDGRDLYISACDAVYKIRLEVPGIIPGPDGRMTSGPPKDASVSPAPRSTTLTAQDYAEIEQLSNRYIWTIDECTNAGYDFADLFTDDGEWSLSEGFGLPGTRAKTKGRDALAAIAGGDGKGGCRDPKTMPGYGVSHVIANHVITPTATGAAGKSYLLAIGVGGDPTKIERQGGYEDVYVKTPAGWKFKSRTHVFPKMSESVQFGPGGRPLPK
jgi:hypothetical protein